jgi:hypothetical protein
MHSKPCIPEMDFAGELVSVALDRSLKPRLEVFGSVSVSERLKGRVRLVSTSWWTLTYILLVIGHAGYQLVGK